MGPDELLLQTDENDDEHWCLMDGGGDLVALAIVDSGNEAWVVRQWTYDAYGAILSADHITSGPALCGAPPVGFWSVFQAAFRFSRILMSSQKSFGSPRADWRVTKISGLIPPRAV